MLPMQVLRYAALSANLASEEPIDTVMHGAYPGRHALWEQYTLIKYIPFNPVDKFTVAVVRENASGRTFRVMKGAPQVMLQPPEQLRTVVLLKETGLT